MMISLKFYKSLFMPETERKRQHIAAKAKCIKHVDNFRDFKILIKCNL